MVMKGDQSAHRHIWGMRGRKKTDYEVEQVITRACFDSLFIVYDVIVWGLHQIDTSMFIVYNSNVIDVDLLRLD